MKIAIISPLPPEQSGIADYAMSFCHALTTKGVTVSPPFKGIKLGNEAKLIDQQMRTVNWLAFELVHVELGGGRNGEFLALEWLAHHYPQIPLTATVHDPSRLVWKPVSPLWINKLPKTLYQLSVLLINPFTLARERRLAGKLSQIICLTHIGAETLKQKLLLPKEKVRTIAHGNHGVTQKTPPPLPPEGRLKLLYFGFIYRGKGIEDLLEALSLILKEHPEISNNIELTLAGGTQPSMTFGNDSSYLGMLKTHIEASGLNKIQINWEHDIEAERIPELVQNHHIMVLPYRESTKLAYLGEMRGTSGALSWAAACGRGVISSDARAFSEEVSYENGIVYPQGDTKALADEIYGLLKTPQTILSYCNEAATLGKNRLWSNIAQQFIDMFTQQINPQEKEK